MPVASNVFRGLVIRKVGVLGAGTMGSRIAAHLANAGIPVLLLDMVPTDLRASATPSERSRIAVAAVELLRKAKPAALYTSSLARLITPGNFEDDMPLLTDCDWIIEAVAEDLQIKHALYGRLLKYKRPESILTTNTSGLSVKGLGSTLPMEHRGTFFGAHFFNPPRYMRLVEIISLSETIPDAIHAIADFCDRRLGKSVVFSRDTPNFIANRIGTFTLSNAIRLMQMQSLSIEEVDQLTGSALGWPKTGTFRLADMVGIDVLANVAHNFEAKAKEIGDERGDVLLPSFIDTMLQRKMLGDKSGQGFYRKESKDAKDRELPEVLDWKTLSYHPATRPKLPSIEMARNIESTSARVAHLFHADASSDKAAAFYWPLLTELFMYAANRISAGDGEPAANVYEVDVAMRTGFNWELGPFELFDAVGVRTTVARMRSLNLPIAANVERLLVFADSLSEENPCWYIDDPSMQNGKLYFDPFSSCYKPIPTSEGMFTLASTKRSRGVVKSNTGASLIDVGDGIAAIELHSKMNALGGDIIALITQVLRPSSDQIAAFDGFIVTGESSNFSVGANLMQLLLAIQDDEWDEVDQMVRSFQNMTQAIKFCPRPVVVAPYGMCLGGGVEMCLHAAARQPHAECYMGLVEAGVGLLPGGGGCKEMLMRSIASATSIRSDGRGEGIEISEAIKKSFEAIAKAVITSSAAEAMTMGFLKSSDQVTINRDRLLEDAKRKARAFADVGYSPPTPRSDIPAPGESIRATLKLAVWIMHQGQYISDHDLKIANYIAHVIAGGSVTSGTPISEQYLLDLERESFLSLCGEKKTQERIAFTLKTGKPLRN